MVLYIVLYMGTQGRYEDDIDITISMEIWCGQILARNGHRSILDQIVDRVAVVHMHV